MTDSLGKFMLSQNQQIKRRTTSIPSHFTGATIFNREIAILTLERKGDTLRLCPEASAHLFLKGRTCDALREFQHEAQQFLRGTAITKIILRGGPESGQYTGGPLGYKIEAALQLISSIDVEIVHANSVNAWQRRYGRAAPATIPGLKYAARQLHQTAIATACYAEAEARAAALRAQGMS